MDHLYNSNILIQSLTESQTNTGAVNRVYATKYPVVPCRINWKSGKESVILNKENYQIHGIIYCSTDYEITTNDRVLYDGIYYNVISYANTDEVSKFQKILISNIKGDNNV